MSLIRSMFRSKNKRPEPLQNKDYDHEIGLVDSTLPGASPSRSRNRPESTTPSGPQILISDSSSGGPNDTPLKQKRTLREELTRRKWRKYRDVHVSADEIESTPELDSATTLPAGDTRPSQDGEEQRGRTRTKNPPKDQTPFEIDVLYENQRGVILCGLHLFSSAALGNLDPSAWTNIANKTSATNIKNAQVPDPSWEWAWPEWIVNHDEGVDEEGWEYSFAFSRKFSWHDDKWYNSFVRRRVWIRKRVKKSAGYHAQHAHILSDNYFTIRPARSRSRATTLTNRDSRYSMALSKRDLEEELKNDDVCNIGTLMRILRVCRIDREKMEAVESFIKHGGDELHYLTDHMHEIMNHFIFQASRRSLLSHLMKNFEEASELEHGEQTKETHSIRQRASNLEAAVRAADEEVKRLEYWSDVKDIAKRGETMGAVDDEQGWRGKWEGLDMSGARDVISDEKAMDINNEHREAGASNESTRKENRISTGEEIERTEDKGKGKGVEKN